MSDAIFPGKEFRIMFVEQRQNTMIEQMQLIVIEQVKETTDMNLLDLVSQLLLFESRK